MKAIFTAVTLSLFLTACGGGEQDVTPANVGDPNATITCKDGSHQSPCPGANVGLNDPMPVIKANTYPNTNLQ